MKVPFDPTRSEQEIQKDYQQRVASGDVGVASSDLPGPPPFDYTDDAFLADLQQRFGVP